MAVRLRSILDEGLSPLINRRLDGLDGVDVTGRDIRLALIVRGVECGVGLWLGAVGASSCSMKSSIAFSSALFSRASRAISAHDAWPSSMSSSSSPIAIIALCLVISIIVQ